MMKPKCCEMYRHFDKNGKLLYVGVSYTTFERLMQHRAASDWFDRIVRIEIERFPTREAALWAEEIAIKEEKPLFNVGHSLTVPNKRKTTEAERLRLAARGKDEFGVIINSGACLNAIQATIEALERGDRKSAKNSSAWNKFNPP